MNKIEGLNLGQYDEDSHFLLPNRNDGAFYLWCNISSSW